MAGIKKFRMVVAALFAPACLVLMFVDQQTSQPRSRHVTSIDETCQLLELQAATRLIHERTLERRVGDFGGNPMSTSELFNVHRCVSWQHDRQLWTGQTAGIAYIVMASKSTRDRAEALLKHWGDQVPAKFMRMYSDIEDPALRMLTLPELAGRGSYVDAQHRPLKGLQHALTTEPFMSADFIMVVDDDTFVNLPQLRYFASQWNPDIPALFGYMWLRVGATWPSGGGGMLITRAAAKMLSDALYTSTCPFEDGHDDVTIGRCCWRLHIPLVHSNQFDSMGELYKWLEPPLQNNAILTSAIALHRAYPERMAQLQRLYDSLSS